MSVDEVRELIKRNLILREYQDKIVFDIEGAKEAIILLAAAPNAGKTEITIAIIINYLKKNPHARILVIPHGTNLLLDNFLSRLDGLNVGFTYSDDVTDDSQVHLSLPHSEGKIKGKYDYLIVDEAHEQYLAGVDGVNGKNGRVQRIIKKVKPSKQLLLTATPSKFIGKKWCKVIAFAANKIPKEFMSPVGIELVESSYNFTQKDYNKKFGGDIKGDFVFNMSDTKETLKNVVHKLIERLNYEHKPKEFNVPNLISKTLTAINKYGTSVLNGGDSWGKVFTKVGKTMIFARTCEQANLIKEVLDEEEVSCVMSHSKNDEHSDELFKFKRGEALICVVVKRGTLGYSDDDLMNIIDISGTHNPDLIYQMFGRLFRGSGNKQKYFMKLTTKDSRNKCIMEMQTRAALMLIHEKYLLTYNGKNMKDIKIPVRRTPNPDGDVRTRESTNQISDRIRSEMDLSNLLILDVVDFFNDVIHNSNNDVSICKMVTIKEAMDMLDGKTAPKSIEDIIYDATDHRN